MQRTTLIIGASMQPERYSYKALHMLLAHGHAVEAISSRPGSVSGITFHVGRPPLQAIDTVTLYINPTIQADYTEYILVLQPRRILFNPGTENPHLKAAAEARGIQCEEACTLVLLQTGQYA
jgi:predicted CoA-binding protein